MSVSFTPGARLTPGLSTQEVGGASQGSGVRGPELEPKRPRAPRLGQVAPLPGTCFLIYKLGIRGTLALGAAAGPCSALPQALGKCQQVMATLGSTNGNNVRSRNGTWWVLFSGCLWIA